MAPRTVLEFRNARALTPYKPEAWLSALKTHCLIDRYPNIYTGLRFGFPAGLPPLPRTFTPPNSQTIIDHQRTFEEIISKEFQKGRYIGPFSGSEVQDTLGNFQTSPLSLIPKPGKPGKFRLVQNLSFPHSPLHGPTSVNSHIDSNNFPTSYSTFPIVCGLLASLPRGSQAAVRDVAEAYRTVPLHPSQWHAFVVRLSENQFAIDSSLCFGFTASGGIYGTIGQAGTDIMRAQGIGPILRWVDDHLFIRLPIAALPTYNAERAITAQHIRSQPNPTIKGGRSWFAGGTACDGSKDEHDDDHAFPLKDLSTSSPRPIPDRAFTYNLSDIDRVSDSLGIPWEASKDIPFSARPIFIGFTWDLDARTVELAEPKRLKYVKAIDDWSTRRMHALEDVQKLHGKLVHAALIFPEGRPFLANLEAMLGIFGNQPFKPRTPPRGTLEDLIWWRRKLVSPPVPARIPSPQPVTILQAFSDASSSTGIGITLNGRWRAWYLRPGWNSDGRDIGWAEAIGLEFLVLAILHAGASNLHFQVRGDNQGVVEGWSRGRSRNHPTNEAFKRIYSALDQSNCTLHTKYLQSTANPADPLSRRIHPPLCFLLPPIHIPPALGNLILDFNDPTVPIGTFKLSQTEAPPPPGPRPHRVC